jgi:LuxR family maltose regulon positive regulatory protein
LTLVSAKAGAGKTTLVSEWLHQQTRPVAWFSLDKNDNDPRRFFSYLVAALQTLDIEIAPTLLSQLETPQLPSVETLITGLVNDVASSASPFFLVLDDYHFIENAWIHEAMGLLVEHQPPEMGLILISRVDPPLPLARLRGRGQMSEVRDRDLRFTVEEAAEFLNDVMGLGLTPHLVATLERHTEGWITGLQMAALSMQGRRQDGDRTAFVEAFGGTHRFILDYLLEEVLDQQAPDVRDFLIETAILDRMCGPLCDTIRFDGTAPVAQDSSQAILETLQRANLFVTSLDDERRWFRYHHLFADLLRNMLKQSKSAEAIRDLHRRAGQWLQSEGYLEEAMGHAMSARDFERAASMIDQNIADMFLRSEVPVLLGWIERLPEQLVRRRPWIDVYRANTLALTGQLVGVNRLLESAEARVDATNPRAVELLGHIAAVRAYAANLRGDAARTLEMAALAKRHLPEARLTARGMAAYASADVHFASDDMKSAQEALLEMLRVGEATGELMLTITALCELAKIKTIQGQLHQAQAYYDRAWRWMAEQRGLDSRVRCAYEFGLAGLLCEWNQLDAAHEHAMIGVTYRQRLGGYWVVGDLPLMRVLQARGDVAGALDVLHNVEQIVQAYHFQMAPTIAFKTARVVQWLAAGDVKTACRWAEACDGGSELEQIALARLRLAQGRANDAQHLLDRQRPLAEAGRRTGRLIDILCLQALALEAQHQSDAAEAVLSQALSLARPEGYVRVFLDLGHPLRQLLTRLAAKRARGETIAQVTAGYARELLAAFQQDDGVVAAQVAPSARAVALVDPLTARELEVLPLLAEGLSNKAIAERLIVAPSTIKQHLKNIYSKLDVHSRTEAVTRGRELGLL